VLDEDAAIGSASHHGDSLVGLLGKLESRNGAPVFEVTRVSDRETLRSLLIRGEARLGLVLPRGFSRALVSAGPPPTATLTGNAASAGYDVAAALVEKVVTGYASKRAQRPPLVVLHEEAVGLSGVRTPFEAYVPGLLVFAVIMLIFSSSMSVVRELEAGTLSRLRLTPVSSVELLIGLSSVQLILGAVSVLATLATACLLGFRYEGSLLLAMSVAILACLASVGIGMFVASLSRTQTRAFLISSTAMFLLVLFSGIIFPQPSLTLFTIHGRAIDLFDALPTTHMATALGKVLILGAGANEVTYELFFLAAVALVNFALGALLLARTGRPSAEVWEGVV